MSSTSLSLTPINGEPRVHDLHLAERLGFDRPSKIREIIKRNEEKLKKFNHLPTVGRCIEIGNGARREVQEYFLDQKQAIFICMKSETDRAFDVQIEIVRVFDAYLSGSLQAPTPAPAPVDLLAAQLADLLRGKVLVDRQQLDQLTRIVGELITPRPLPVPVDVADVANAAPPPQDPQHMTQHDWRAIKPAVQAFVRSRTAFQIGDALAALAVPDTGHNRRSLGRYLGSLGLRNKHERRGKNLLRVYRPAPVAMH